jgi:MFS transporter, ACS family, tartrate transporter
LAGALLKLNGDLGLKGWQWLYLAEGLPAALLGITVLYYLTERPREAHWLTPEERALLDKTLADECDPKRELQPHSIAQALSHPTVWLLGVLLFLVNVGFYGYLIWAPQIIKSFLGASDLMVGWILGAISTIMAAGMIWNGTHSDRTGDRRFHVVIPLLIAATGFIATASLSSPVPATCALALIPLGIASIYGPIWSVPSNFLSAEAAAAGMGLIGTVANFGGFFGPYLIGFLKDRYGGYSASFVMLAILATAAAGLALLIPAQSLRPRGLSARTEW